MVGKKTYSHSALCGRGWTWLIYKLVLVGTKTLQQSMMGKSDKPEKVKMMLMMLTGFITGTYKFTAVTEPLTVKQTLAQGLHSDHQNAKS